jgi:hypothetical protein
MSSTGSNSPNLRSGRRSEYLAQYVFASFGAAVPVPQPEDFGVDLFCTLTERVGQREWPLKSFSVQVKSAPDWTFDSRESVRWLVKHPQPLFLCVVDKPTSTLSIFHTQPRYHLWLHSWEPEHLRLIGSEGTEGYCTAWQNLQPPDIREVHLGPPIARFDVAMFADDAFHQTLRDILIYWTEIAELNLHYMRSGLRKNSDPYRWTTNQIPSGMVAGRANSKPDAAAEATVALKGQLEFLCEALYRKKDRGGTIRAFLLLRHLFGDDIRPSTFWLEFHKDMKMPLVEEKDGDLISYPDFNPFEAIDCISKGLDSLSDPGASVSNREHPLQVSGDIVNTSLSETKPR